MEAEVQQGTQRVGRTNNQVINTSEGGENIWRDWGASQRLFLLTYNCLPATRPRAAKGKEHNQYNSWGSREGLQALCCMATCNYGSRDLCSFFSFLTDSSKDLGQDRRNLLKGPGRAAVKVLWLHRQTLPRQAPALMTIGLCAPQNPPGYICRSVAKGWEAQGG